MTDDVHKAIDEAVKKNRVIVFMKGTPSFPQCGFSAATIACLREVGAPFEAVNVLTDSALREGVKAYSSWPTIPQVFIDGKFVGGCDIVKELHAKGELARMIKGG